MANKIEAAAVFVGCRLGIPELGIDDLAGEDLKGKFAVYLTGGPRSIPGLVGTGRTIVALLELANDDKPLPKFPWQVTIRA